MGITGAPCPGLGLVLLVALNLFKLKCLNQEDLQLLPWCPSGFCFGPTLIYHLFTSSWPYFQKICHLFSLLCRRHPALPIFQQVLFFFSFLTICLAEMKDWLSANFLKLNSDETEVLLIGTKSTLTKSVVR